MNIEMPLDAGFLRRQCPNCNQEFKWHHGQIDGAPEVSDEGDNYYCPLCGEPAAKDAWYTHEQIDFIHHSGTTFAHREIQDLLADAFRGSKGVKYKPGDVAGGPAALMEPSDMVAVQAPCHPWEPVKIPENWSDDLHCLICGAAFRV